MTQQTLLNLAAKVAPFVRMQAELEGRHTLRQTKDALARSGFAVSERTVLRIDDIISNYYV